MKIPKTILLFLLLIPFGGCSSGFQVYKTKPDQFNPGANTYFSDPISIHSPAFLQTGMDNGDIAIYFFNKNGASGSWQLETHVKRDIKLGWMFVNSITLRLDTSIITLTSAPSPTREVMTFMDLNWCDEINFFPVDEAVIRHLSLAKSAAIRIEGEKALYDHNFDTTEINHVAYALNNIKQLTSGN